MDEEEDWDAAVHATAKTTLPQQSNTSTPQQTLKITDGYKYSYEALSSPANIEDWVEAPSYAASRHSANGYIQNSFKDIKSFRNERNDRNDRNDTLKRNDKHNSSVFDKHNTGDFGGTPKPGRFSNRSNAGPVADWDAPKNSTNESWNVNIPINTTTEDDWDADGKVASLNHKSISKPTNTFIPNNSKQNSSYIVEEENWDDTPLGASKTDKSLPAESSNSNLNDLVNNSMHSLQNKSLSMLESNQSNVINDDEENWDEPSRVEPQDKSASQVIMPTYKSNDLYSPMQGKNQSQNDDEDWDADMLNQSMPNTSDNGFAKNIPSYQSNNSDDQLYSGNQRYENNWHSNKYPPRSRNFDSNDHFGREPFNRHSRGNYRHNNPYDRVSRGGRGARGSRGGRGGRDSSFNPRDNSRNRGDRIDRSYQKNSFNKSSDRQPYQPPISFNNTVVEPEEDWDAPTGLAPKASEKNAPPLPQIVSSVQQGVVEEEESWD